MADGPDYHVKTTETLTDKIVDEVIAGAWGNGKARVKALTKAGYDWREIQNKINKKLGCSTRHFKTWTGKVWNGGKNERTKI